MKNLRNLKKVPFDVIMHVARTLAVKDMPNNQALFEELNDYTNHYREME